MDAPRNLVQIQEWTQAAVTHPSGPAFGDEGQLEAVVARSRRQTSLERLEVYANAYYARLMQCLRELFPATREALGDEAFDDLAFGYLQVNPPRSYTLGKLADRFVEYLDRSRADGENAAEAPRTRSEGGDETTTEESALDQATCESNALRLAPCPQGLSGYPDAEFRDWSRFIVELARFEQVIDDVFDGPGLEGCESPLAEQLAQCGAEELAASRLVAAPCLRLLRCEFPVNDYYSAYRARAAGGGAGPETPAPSETFVAVHRANYVVRRQPLTATQYRLLEVLAAGHPIVVAVEGLANAPDTIDAVLLRQWFADWTAAGFFERLDRASQGPTN